MDKNTTTNCDRRKDIWTRGKLYAPPFVAGGGGGGGGHKNAFNWTCRILTFLKLK